MGRLAKQKRQLIEQANKRLLGEDIDSDDIRTDFPSNLTPDEMGYKDDVRIGITKKF